MGAILEQLGLDQTFYFEFALIAVVFFILRIVYFKPFLKLLFLLYKVLLFIGIPIEVAMLFTIQYRFPFI